MPLFGKDKKGKGKEGKTKYFSILSDGSAKTQMSDGISYDCKEHRAVFN